MLLQFSVSHPILDPETTVLIRSCTLVTGDASNAKVMSLAASGPVDNPKTADSLFETSLHTAPACYVDVEESDGKLDFLSSSGIASVSGEEITTLLGGVRQFFEAEDNCDESFLFAYYKETVASVYIGAGLGKLTVSSALKTVTARVQTETFVANRTVAQICHGETKSELGFGVAIDTTGNLGAVQRAAMNWRRGVCASDKMLDAPTEILNTKIHTISQAGTASNTTLAVNGTFIAQPSRRVRSPVVGRDISHKRATCSYMRVDSGDGCASLAAKCGIRGSDFVKFNPQSDLCSTLVPGNYVCCSSGDPYVPPKPPAPKPDADGTCATHLIENGDTCAALAKKYGITVEDIEKFNENTWAWTECKQMLLGYNMCLSKGQAPLPPPQQGAQCGPLVPGTQWSDKTTPMADLNPCPLKACCSNWGFCGPFTAHCDIHAPPNGGPGAKLPGFQNTCVSNCGNDIKQNSGPPKSFGRIGYYESWNLQRDCLWLKAEDANVDGTYTIIHWGFIDIDATTFKPVINDPSDQWEGFKSLKGVKRVVSFGGWAYSTEPATYNIIRSAIIANREVFATNIARFLEDEGLDGVDIDWEYPGVSLFIP